MAWWQKLGKETLSNEDNKDFVSYLFDGKFSQNECIGIYDKWASSYDKDVEKVCKEREGPKYVADKAYELLGKSDGNQVRLLDVGAGTGIVGQLLKNKGFTCIDALDPSEEMLAVAKTKNIYCNFICEFLTEEPLDIPADSYDAIVSCGSILAGHIPPTAFAEMYRLVKPGGFIIFAFADYYLEKEAMDTGSFYKLLNDYETEKKWKIFSLDHIKCFHNQPYIRSGKCQALKVLS